MNKLSISLAAFALFGAVSAQAAESTALMGTMVDASQATRTITISPSTKYVNVKEDDTVRFVVNDKAFGYRFDGVNQGGSIDLQQVAPQGMLDHTVTAYIAVNPSDTNRAGF